MIKNIFLWVSIQAAKINTHEYDINSSNHIFCKTKQESSGHPKWVIEFVQKSLPKKKHWNSILKISSGKFSFSLSDFSYSNLTDCGKVFLYRHTIQRSICNVCWLFFSLIWNYIKICKWISSDKVSRKWKEIQFSGFYINPRRMRKKSTQTCTFMIIYTSSHKLNFLLPHEQYLHHHSPIKIPENVEWVLVMTVRNEWMSDYFFFIFNQQLCPKMRRWFRFNLIAANQKFSWIFS